MAVKDGCFKERDQNTASRVFWNLRKIAKHSREKTKQTHQEIAGKKLGKCAFATLKHLAVKDGRAKESDQKTAWRVFGNVRKTVKHSRKNNETNIAGSSRKRPGKRAFATTKHHGSEGRRTFKIVPKKLPNVASETNKDGDLQTALKAALVTLCSSCSWFYGDSHWHSNTCEATH